MQVTKQTNCTCLLVSINYEKDNDSPVVYYQGKQFMEATRKGSGD